MRTTLALLLLSAVLVDGRASAVEARLQKGAARDRGDTTAVLVLSADGPRPSTVEQARREGLLVVDLSDQWVPFLFSESDRPGAPVKPNGYRETFVALANDLASPEEIFLESSEGRAAVLAMVPEALRSTDPQTLSPAEKQALERAERSLSTRRKPNFLEVYGIPPTLAVLARRVAADAARACYATVDRDGLRDLDFEIGYQSREQARREYEQALEDAAWAAERAAGQASVSDDAASDAQFQTDAQDAGRVARYRRGQMRLRAVRAVQARLGCEGLLPPEGRFTSGSFDLATHLALAEFERENDIFGWGFVSGETQAALQRSPTELHFETFRRIIAERVADAAGIVEDGSISRGDSPATFTDAAGAVHPVPNLIDDFVDALLRALDVASPDDLASFLGSLEREERASLRIAFEPPRLPPYYAPIMDLSAEIDRGDVWYDFPFDGHGRSVVQRRRRYPSFTLFVTWRQQKIPLVRWRTTIGSWRSEIGSDGQIYLRYKNSDVGPRIWKDIVAAPVWVPPQSTPGKDLLTKKVFDRKIGPVNVVNTEVMGPGFASAYGLVMAIHLEKRPDGSLFDNQIRTHGSVDYTSIARRFSHGCHRLVNVRAVRLFDFVLKHRRFRRLGDRTLKDYKRRFVHQGRVYRFELRTRGYYYELRPAMPLDVLEGRIVGGAQSPPRGFFRKPGVEYGQLPVDGPVQAPEIGP